MRKTLVMTLLLSAALSACSSTPSTDIERPQAFAGQNNPAADYCESLKGQYERAISTQGERGYCHLPNGVMRDAQQLLREKP
ncbi:putative hemolysin [Atopomonas sediminilitoris]|uniref:putative hemolysin n=1 Tax=Atopomonas sediminilitoris TaxID=2919919 RepID=UPI001F4D55CB|nr:DUF333 domain-containing protein [Atopomonas sediminilitoris]MCJ8169505.1 DUF333 domain-containing protein [Atopomonas sediminilitoris]